MAVIPPINTIPGTATNAPNAAANTINPTVTAVNSIVTSLGGSGTSVPAGTPISSLPAATTFTGSELVPVQQNGATVAAGIAQFNTGAAGTAISALPAATAFTGAEIFPFVQGGATVQGTLQKVGAQYIAMSKIAGIDPTGATDSLAAVQTAFNTYAGTNYVLLWDCPILISTYQVGNPTQFATVLYVPSNLNVQFTDAGLLICNNAGLPCLTFLNVSNIIFQNAKFSYITDFGALYAITHTNFDSAGGNFNTTTLTAKLASQYVPGVSGNSFTSQTSVFNGATNISAIILLCGACNNIQFLGGSISVPANATASAFPITAINGYRQWIPGTAVNSGTAQNSSTCTAPSNIVIRDFTLDGTQMGINGEFLSIYVTNLISKRYSDLQTTAGLYPGGAGFWSPPPHLFYLQSPIFACQHILTNIQDQGIYVGTPIRRSTGSGYCNSFKAEPGSGSVVDGYYCYRPDGWMDVLTYSHPNATYKNIYVKMDTTTSMYVSGPLVNSAAVTITSGSGYTAGTYTAVPITNVSGGLNGGGALATIVVAGGVVTTVTITTPGHDYQLRDVLSVAAANIGGTGSGFSFTVNTAAGVGSTPAQSFAIRFPGSSPITNFMLDMVVVDTAAVPAGFPILSDASSGHQNLQWKLKCSVQDWPNTPYTSPSGNASNYNTTYPGFGVGGSENILDFDVAYAACTSTQTFRGTFCNQGSVALSNSVADVRITGWRSINSSLDNLKQRLLFTGISAGGFNAGNRIRILDVSNNHEQTIDDALVTETWAQSLQVTPAAGATYDTTIVYPNNFAVDQQACIMGPTPPGGPTSIQFGDSASAARFFTTTSVAANAQTIVAAFNPIPLVNSPTTLRLTSVGGAFTGTGSLVVGLRCRRHSISQ